MDERTYTIRPMSLEEVELAVDWAEKEGWNPGLRDAQSFYAADEQGFLIGLLDDEPIATISAVRYGETFGFIGFYIVKPEYRGKGFGLSIWNAAMQQLNGRIIGLDGVVDQQHNYKKSGFELAYRNIRYEGKNITKQSFDHPDVVPVSSVPFEQLEAYDGLFFPEQRTEFLKQWVDRDKGKALAYLNDFEQIVGYGVIRSCREGFKIGPLFADRESYAQLLFNALVSDLPSGTPFYLDIPEVNATANDLVERHNMNRVFETARMYRGKPPILPLRRLYGVTSFELG